MVMVKERRVPSTLVAQSRYAIYALNFLLTLHVAMVSYYLSPFLVSRGIPDQFVGVIFAIGSMVALFAIAYAPYFLKRQGNYTNILTLGLLQLLAFLSLVFAESTPLIIALFLIVFVAPTLVGFSLDIFLEGTVESEATTSSMRSIFLTAANVAWLAAPLIGGFLVVNGIFDNLFVIAALIFVPFIFLSASQLEYFRDPKYKALNIVRFVTTLRRSANFRGVFAAQFLLRFFFSTLIVYLPLYVHKTLGIPLSEFGMILSFGMIAYLILEIPLGKIMDASWGEKEVLIIGLAILAFATASISFITSTSLVLWGIGMFVTRIGAAMIEVASEGYFFKHVDADDADVVSAFRMLYPLAYIMSPLIGTLLLFVLPLQYIFIVAAFIIFSGIWFVAPIQDTK